MVRRIVRLASYSIVRPFTSIAIALFLFGAVPATAEDAPVTPPVDAAKTEVVGFQDASGNTVFLHDFKGKAVVLNLWASWCVPCVQEMGSLGLLQQEFKDKGLVVLALSEDDSLAQATEFYKKKGITSLAPFFDKDHIVWAALEARGIPTSVLINKDGVAVQRIEGPVDWQSLAVKNDVTMLLTTGTAQ